MPAERVNQTTEDCGEFPASFQDMRACNPCSFWDVSNIHNSEVIAWIGGWGARSRDLIPDWLSETPRRGVIPINSLDPEDIKQQLAALPAQTPVVAWSLGTWAILRCWTQGGGAHGPLVLVCPIVDFCGTGSRWKPRVLARMAARLREEPATVLHDFVESWGSVKASLWHRSWLSHALDRNPDELADDLALLTGPAVDPNLLPTGPRLWLRAETDGICPPLPPLPGEDVRVIPGGHDLVAHAGPEALRWLAEHDR